MITTYAIMSDVDAKTAKVSVWLKIKGKEEIAYHEFDTSSLAQFYRLTFILDTTKAKSLDSIKEKSIRVIYTEGKEISIVAIGAPIDNKFVDLRTDELHPVSERKIYRRYRKKA